ncbi:HEXXH motif domain-containing protein [Herbidospora sp. RD11066]
MTRRYTLPGDVFTELATGAGGQRAMRFLADTQHSKNLLLIRMVVTAAERTGHERAGELAEAWDLLAGLQHDHPEAVETVLRWPSVGTWAMRMLSKVLPNKSGGPVAFAYLPGMAVAAAVRAGVTAEVGVSVPGGRMVLPSLGVARLFGATRHTVESVPVRIHADGAELRLGGMTTYVPRRPERFAEGWLPLRRLSTVYQDTRFEVWIDDVDPFRLPEDWPAGRQRPASIRQWQRAFDDAWILLKDHHPWYADEVVSGITTFVPMARPYGRPTSATSRNSFGAFAVSLPPDGRMLASLMSHEIQHAKLWALLDLVQLTKPVEAGDRPLWYAPWREDPRPLVALLQGAYAHLAVAAFWRVQRFLDQGQDALRAHAEYARWRQLTDQVIDTLRTCGMLTEAGDAFVEGMASTLAGWRDDEVPYTAAKRAREAAHDHKKRFDRG